MVCEKKPTLYQGITTNKKFALSNPELQLSTLIIIVRHSDESQFTSSVKFLKLALDLALDHEVYAVDDYIYIATQLRGVNCRFD